MKFTSIFKSIQGEGKNTGRNTVFLRVYTERCFPNYRRCKFCDTIGKDYFKPVYDLKDVNSFLKENPSNMVTITGGEFFSLTEMEIFELLELLENHVSEVEIETNGAFLTCELLEELTNCNVLNVNISPKLKNSGVNYEYDFSELKKIANDEEICFKFVVNEKRFENDINDIEEFLKEINCKYLQNGNVWLMAETPTSEKFKKKLFDFCSEKNYNYSARIHDDLFRESEEDK